MHHALQIPEILLNIFRRHDSVACTYGYLPWNMDRPTATPDLVALARTCRAFREPALDVLWSALEDLSPLARCLPDVSHPKSQLRRTEYVFTRPLMQTEWDILQSYTRRIRTVLRFDFGLDWDSFRTLQSPSVHLIFPNLCHAEYGGRECDIYKLPMRQPLPSLTSLTIMFPGNDRSISHQCLQWFSELAPNVKNLCTLSKTRCMVGIGPVNISSEHICGWRNLEKVICREASLDIDALVHLSRMPALTDLSVLPSNTIPMSVGPPQIFAKLNSIKVNLLPPTLLVSFAKFLSHIQLPIITELEVETADCPPGSLRSFLLAVETACLNRSLTHLQLKHYYDNKLHIPTLTFHDLQPILAFSDIRFIDLSVSSHVVLTDSELVKLASAWPHVEVLFINLHRGWGTPVASGITPEGVFHVLQICPSLNYLCLAIDTRGYTKVSSDSSLARLEWNTRKELTICVVDSIIEEGSIEAMATFFAGIHRNTYFRLEAHESNFGGPSNLYVRRWEKVYYRARHIRWCQHALLEVEDDSGITILTTTEYHRPKQHWFS